MRKGKALVKVIIETSLLTEEEKVRACQLSVKAGADFVKTSTGFSTGGATPEDIALMRKTVGENTGVKASGGVREGRYGPHDRSRRNAYRCQLRRENYGGRPIQLFLLNDVANIRFSMIR